MGSFWASQVALVVKNSSANAGGLIDVSSIPGSGRSSGGGHGNPLQYSCLENAMGRGALQAMVHRVTKSQTQLKRLGIHDEIYASVLTHFFTPFGPWEGIMNLEEAVSSAKSNFWR